MNIFKKMFGSVQDKQSSVDDELILYTKTVLFYAKEAAQKLNASQVEPEHVFLGILAHEGTNAKKALYDGARRSNRLYYTTVFKLLQDNALNESLESHQTILIYSKKVTKIIQRFLKQNALWHSDNWTSTFILIHLLNNLSDNLNQIFETFHVTKGKLGKSAETQILQSSKMERFTNSARQALEHALDICEKNNETIIDCDHLLVALYAVPGVACQALRGMELKEEMLTAHLVKTESTPDPTVLDLSERIKRVLEQAVDRARREKREIIRTDDLLFAIITTQNKGLAILQALPIDIKTLTLKLREAINHPISFLEVATPSFIFSEIYTAVLNHLLEREHSHLEAEHLIGAFAQSGFNSSAGRLLNKLNTSFDKISQTETNILNNSGTLHFAEDLLEVFSTLPQHGVLTSRTVLLAILNANEKLYDKFGFTQEELQEVIDTESEAIAAIELP